MPTHKRRCYRWPATEQTPAAITNPTLPTSSRDILGSILRVLQEGADVSLAVAAPQRISHLAVSPRVFPDHPAPQNFPFMLAADASGSPASRPSSTPRSPASRLESPDLESLRWAESNPCY